MKLKKKQRKLVEKFADDLYTVSFLEKYYGESPNLIPSLNYSFAVMNCNKANAFMSAINGVIEKVL